MINKKAKTASLDEFRALMRLKKAGVLELAIEFEGSDDSGYFDFLSVLPKEWNLHKQYEAELQLADNYIDSNVDLYGGHIDFNGDGCRGVIKINLQNELPELCFVVYVPTETWRLRTNYTSEISPGSEVERIMIESDT